LVEQKGKSSLIEQKGKSSLIEQKGKSMRYRPSVFTSFKLGILKKRGIVHPQIGGTVYI
jgi:hypothetical protein